jgi:hypothetical protein
MPVSGTVTASGNFRTANLGGLADWGTFKSAGLACDNTHCYLLFTNNTSATIGAADCHLCRVPWATWTVAATEVLRSFSRVTGTAQNANALCLRPSDGLIACRLFPGDLFTFDPGAAFAETYLGLGGNGSPNNGINSVDFDPNDDTALWHGGYSTPFRKWKIGTGNQGALEWLDPTYSLRFSPDGQGVGVAAWDIAGNPKGVLVFDPVTGSRKCPFGLRWLNTDRNGAGNANHTENTLANRAAVGSAVDACMDLDGLIYVVSTTGDPLRVVSADWLAVTSITGITEDGNSHVCVSPDGTKVAVSGAEQVYKVT